MNKNTCLHLVDELTNYYFRIINDILVVGCVCKKCDEEFFRGPNSTEIAQAKALGIIK